MSICGIANGREPLLFSHSHYTVSPAPNHIFIQFIHGSVERERERGPFPYVNNMETERDLLPESCWCIHQASFLLQAMRLTY